LYSRGGYQQIEMLKVLAEKTGWAFESKLDGQGNISTILLSELCIQRKVVLSCKDYHVFRKLGSLEASFNQ
jgi:hypothetical protein